MTTSYSYDTLSRLLQALHQKGTTLVEGAAYSYDAAGNRSSKIETTPGKHGTSTKTDTFSYDAIYELTQAATNGNTTDLDTYDAVGNRLNDVFGGTYSYNNSNELLSYPAYSWTYDNNGNTTSKTVSGSTTTYNWDFENRLASVALPGTGGTVNFKYDPFGRRIYKSSSSGTTIYAYDGDNRIEDLSSTGTATARYTQDLGIDEPLEVYEGGKSYYYHADGLGSIVALTKSTGTAANTYFGYNTFGGMPGASETVSNPFRFTAREWDSETGLYFYRARYYDSLFGRFLSEDPVWLRNGRGMYNYVENSPTTFTDPIGLFTVTNQIRQHRTLGIENVCPEGNGGACTIRLTAGLTCDCKCDGGTWKASANLTLTGDLFVWNGPWPYKGRQPKDKTVHDAASAIAHENNVHINPAIAALASPINNLESKNFKSEGECKAECSKTSRFVNALFRATLAATQEEENKQ